MPYLIPMSISPNVFNTTRTSKRFFRVSSLKLTATLACILPFAFTPFALQAEEIDLTKPVSESLPGITGIYITGDTLVTDAETPYFPDSSGNEYHAKIDAGIGAPPSLTPGVDIPGTSGFGNAIRIERKPEDSGTTGNPRAVAALPEYNNLAMVATSFTAGAWIKFNSIPDEPHAVVVMDRGGRSTTTGENAGHWSFYLHQTTSGNWRMEFTQGDGISTAQRTATAATNWQVDLLDWNHVAFTYHYISPNNASISFYLNGTLLEEIPVSATLISSGSTHWLPRRFAIGERPVSNYFSNFNGAIDDLFVTEGVHTFSPL